MSVIATLYLILAMVVLLALAGYKTYRLPRATKRKQLRRWFYFNKHEIYGNQDVADERIFQNYLSRIIVIYVLFGTLLFCFIALMTGYFNN